MQILVLGGSGRTGKLVIEEALQRGHTITALVRYPDAAESDPRLTVVKGRHIPLNSTFPLAATDNDSGSPTSEADLVEAFKATATPPAAVIVTLNATRASDSPFAAPLAPPRMMADSNANAIAVMKQYGVRKIVTMSAFGVADSAANANCLLKLVLRKTNMKYQFEDHDLVDAEVKKSGVDYVLVRPVMLVEGDTQTVKEFGNEGLGVGIMSKITRRTVANFLVDAAEKSSWDRTTPVISN